jgi:hypothetical protein
MELVDRTVVVYVNEQGFLDLKSLLGIESSLQGSVCQVLGADGFGVWVPLGEDLRRIVIVPWHYVRAFELEQEMLGPVESSEKKKRIGF